MPPAPEADQNDSGTTLPIKLRDVVEAMDLPNQEWHSYVHRDTGEIVTVTDEECRLVEEDDANLDHVPDWQRETLPKAREALESDRFLALPDSFEIHEWSIMERFAQSQSDDRPAEELLDALHGRGAFRMFRSVIRRLGVEDDWYRFRESAFEDIARDWLEDQGIAYQGSCLNARRRSELV